jgi:hypothetical protein
LALWLFLLGLCVGMMHATKETCVIALFAMAVAGLMTVIVSFIITLAVPSTVGTLRQMRSRSRETSGERLKSPNSHESGYREERTNASAGITALVVASMAGTLRQMGAGQAVISGLIVILSSLVVLLIAASVSMLFFSSFLDNPGGVLDSISTYSYYLGRAAGEGNASDHVHRWHYYLRILFWWHEEGGRLWTEAAVAVLALTGLIAGVASWGRNPRSAAMVSFLGIYTLVMILVYSAIPYKTPWCAIGFLHGMILLAGVGMTVLVRAAPGYTLKGVVIAALVAATGHLAFQAYRASFVAYEDRHNPYVYSPTTSDVPVFAERIRQIALAHPDGKAMHVQVICPERDYWPLPWYLRDMPRIGWFSDAPTGAAAPLIITQPKLTPVLTDYLYVKQPPGHRHLYVQLPPKEEGQEWTLRPFVPLIVYAQRDFWLEYQAGKPERDP